MAKRITLPQRSRKRCFIVHVESDVPWPTEQTVVHYEGLQLLLMPETKDEFPAVACYYEPPLERDSIHVVIRRFLSALSWSRQSGIQEVAASEHQDYIPYGKLKLGAIDTRFRDDHLPAPASQQARLALALYREALMAGSISYKFLCLFKILNIKHDTRLKQAGWINAALSQIQDETAEKRLQEIRANQDDVGIYLYESGRCAVAHSFSSPLINPDELEDTRRLWADLPIIRCLAERYIEHELSVPSYLTILREHKFELEGFRQLLGEAMVRTIQSNQDLDPGVSVVLPHLSLRLRERQLFPTFEAMLPTGVFVGDGKLWIRLKSVDSKTLVLIQLDFMNERLRFDPERGIACSDESDLAALQGKVDRLRFLDLLLGNGELELWDADRKEMLGRCRPCIPVNIDSQTTHSNLTRGILDLEAKMTNLLRGAIVYLFRTVKQV